MNSTLSFNISLSTVQGVTSLCVIDKRIRNVISFPSAKLFINAVNSCNRSTGPCGTPLITPWRKTIISTFLPHSQFSTQVNNLPPIQRVLILTNGYLVNIYSKKAVNLLLCSFINVEVAGKFGNYVPYPVPIPCNSD